MFADLGPVAVFNARNHWSAPREVRMRKKDRQGFGFSVRGDAPVIVAGVDSGSLAELGGLKDGDYIVGINSADVKWSPHDEVVSLIKASGHSLKLRVVTPMMELVNGSRDKVMDQRNSGKSSLGEISAIIASIPLEWMGIANLFL